MNSRLRIQLLTSAAPAEARQQGAGQRGGGLRPGAGRGGPRRACAALVRSRPWGSGPPSPPLPGGRARPCGPGASTPTGSQGSLRPEPSILLPALFTNTSLDIHFHVWVPVSTLGREGGAENHNKVSRFSPFPDPPLSGASESVAAHNMSMLRDHQASQKADGLQEGCIHALQKWMLQECLGTLPLNNCAP